MVRFRCYRADIGLPQRPQLRRNGGPAGRLRITCTPLLQPVTAVHAQALYMPNQPGLKRTAAPIAAAEPGCSSDHLTHLSFTSVERVLRPAEA